MNRYILSITSVIIFIISVNWNKSRDVQTPVQYYFKYIGVPDSQEGDVTKWEFIGEIEYALTYCPGTKFGCKLIATDIQVINSEVRPKSVYLIPFSKNPTTGTYVITVKNKSS